MADELQHILTKMTSGSNREVREYERKLRKLVNDPMLSDEDRAELIETIHARIDVMEEELEKETNRKRQH